MKKIAILLSTIFLLASCDNENVESSTTPNSSEQVSETTSSSEERIVTDEEKMAALASKLKTLEGHVNKTTTTMAREMSYASDGSFAMYVYDDIETIRYTRGNSFLVETKQTERYNEETDTTSATIQTYDDGLNIYRVSAWEGAEKDVQKFLWTKESAELNYSIGFALSEEQNFNAMIENSSNNSLIEYSFDNIDGIIENNQLKYSYSLRQYSIQENKKTLTQEIAYENTFTIENDLVTKLDQIYETIIYVGQVNQSLTVNLTTNYFQGEYQEFTGEVLSNK